MTIIALIYVGSTSIYGGFFAFIFLDFFSVFWSSFRFGTWSVTPSTSRWTTEKIKKIKKQKSISKINRIHNADSIAFKFIYEENDLELVKYTFLCIKEQLI